MIPIKFRENFVKWSKFSCTYATIKYTCTTKNAQVRYGNTYRNLLLAERLCVIGLGTALSPICLPFDIIYDLSCIECIVKDLDPQKAGFVVSNKRRDWIDHL